MFTMPTPDELAAMDTTAIDNKRIEAENAAVKISADLTIIKMSRNDLKRRDIDLADHAAKAVQMLRELRVAIDTLKTAYWQRRNP